jgi:hypothetical protein
MIFVEKLTIFNLIKIVLGRKKFLYGTKSVGTRVAEKLLVRLRVMPTIQKLDFGNIDIAPDIRKRAYEKAEDYLETSGCKKWADEISQLLSININLIAKKFFFDELYTKYEFYEVALRYAIENPHERHVIYIQRLFAGQYASMLKNHLEVIQKTEFERLSFFCSLLFLPLLLLFYRVQNSTHDDLHFDNEIVCYVDDESTYEMYSNLFKSYPQPKYVIEKHNVKWFTNGKLQKLKIRVLGLTKESYSFLKKIIPSYMAVCLKYSSEISKYGMRFFWLFLTVIRGKAEAIHGKGNFFFTYEHLITVKAARNEFLRLEGNKSVFIPKNAHASPLYFHSEIFINYDVMCTAGKHIEELYKKKKAMIKMYLPTGSYDNHRKIVDSKGKNERIAKLKSFKGDSIAVTILSPGICDPTYSHEIKLMKLAQKLAQQKSIKVFIRMKPVPLIPKYSTFYAPYTEGQDSIMLTAAEYELFDFLEVTDLFITSISNSACDVAMCGSQVMFIDYMKNPDLFLYWMVVKDLVLNEENAFEEIMKWVNNKKDGQIRTRHAETMKQLTEYIGYSFPDFESYKTNIISQLQEHVFCDNTVVRKI